MRLAHISDLHFACPNLSPIQLLSKRWLGNLNFALKRRNLFDYTERLPALLDLFKREKITHVAISGDLSITSHPKEFKQAAAFIQALQKEGYKTFTIPGNHDHYTKPACRKKLFYRYFPAQHDERCRWNLKEHRVTSLEIEPHLWLVSLDTASATSLFSSVGHFYPQTEENLNALLKNIPANDSVILLNHFPFFQNDRKQNRLLRGDVLRSTIEKHRNILLYLHGHTHRQTVADLRDNRLPILSDPGSAPERSSGACHLIQIDQEKVHIDVYRWQEKWKCLQKNEFKR